MRLDTLLDYLFLTSQALVPSLSATPSLYMSSCALDQPPNSLYSTFQERDVLAIELNGRP